MVVLVAISNLTSRGHQRSRPFCLRWILKTHCPNLSPSARFFQILANSSPAIHLMVACRVKHAMYICQVTRQTWTWCVKFWPWHLKVTLNAWPVDFKCAQNIQIVKNMIMYAYKIDQMHHETHNRRHIMIWPWDFFKGQPRSSDAYLKVVLYLNLIPNIQSLLTENSMLYSFFAQSLCLTALL